MRGSFRFRFVPISLCKLASGRLARRIGLLAFVVAACLVVVVTRWSYPYPSHTDEWTSLAYAEALVQHGTVPHPDPVFGQGTVGFRPELGFRGILAEARLATGVAWDRMFPILPAILFAVFAVLMLYLGILLGAGALVGIMALGTPSTVRFLGPALAVPLTLGLILILSAAIVLLQRPFGGRWSKPVLVAGLLLAALFVHPPTVLVGAPVLAAVAVYLAARERRAEAGPLLASAASVVILPVIWFLSLPGPVRSGLVSEAGVTVSRGQGLVTDFAGYVGPVRLGLFTIAVFGVLFWRVSLRSGIKYLAVLVAYAAVIGFIVLHSLGVLPAANLYDRVWIYLDVLLSIITGLGLAAIAERIAKSQSRILQSLHRRQAWAMAAIALVVVVGSVYIQSREPWYRYATQADIEDFRWIGEHLSQYPGLTLLDPYLAVAYPSLAGRPVYASAAEPNPSPDSRMELAAQLLQSPKPDVAALRQAEIGIVYQPWWQSFAGVVEVRPGIFVVPAAGGGP